MIGFEFDGLYWHSQLAGSRLSLLAKTHLCEAAGITLVHVLEDEWNLREEQCKARIRQTLGFHTDCMKITFFKRLSGEEADVFLERNSYDLFAKHSTQNFAAVGEDGQILAYAGASISSNAMTLRNLCCNVSCASFSMLESLIEHVCKEYGSRLKVRAVEDNRWPLPVLNDNWSYCKFSGPARWTIDCSTWKRTGRWHDSSSQTSCITSILDCGNRVHDRVCSKYCLT